MIDATISTYSPVGQKALFAVKISDDNDNTHERVVPLASKNAYTAHLLAVKYICEAVENKDSSLKITTSMPYILNAFKKDEKGWKKTRKRGSNPDLVDEVKVLLNAFKSFSIVIDSDGPTALKTDAKSYSSI